MAKLQKGINDLKTWCLNNGDFGQQVLKEWTGECEDGRQYEIDEVSFGSKKKLKWRCDKGHVWTVGTNSRTAYKTGCPICSRDNVGAEISKARIIKGVNDLKTWCLNAGDFGQKLLQEWTGKCTDGKIYNIESVAVAGYRVFEWVCASGHTWSTTVASRTASRSGCPYCYNLKRSDLVRKARLTDGVNDLSTWCSNHGAWGRQLIQEWTGVCIDGNQYALNDVAFGSAKKFKWICKEGHEWYSDVSHRTLNERGCPQCSFGELGSKVSRARLHIGVNDLYTWCLNNGEFGQQLISEWTGECEDKSQYAIDSISFGSYRRLKWRCSEGHEWYSTVGSRTRSKCKCPYCTGALVSDNNSFGAWCINNAEFGNQLLHEWTGECEDGKHYEIDGVSFGSNRKFKWRCNKHHEWYTAVTYRTHGKTGCPHCSNRGTSYPEQVIYRSMLQLFPNTIHRGKYGGYEFDITVPEFKVCIEYGSIFWHADKLDRDNEKKKFCEKYGVQLIQVYEHNGEIDSDDVFDGDLIIYRVEPILKELQLKEIISHILNQFNHSVEEIDFEKACKDAFNFMHSADEDTDGENP